MLFLLSYLWSKLSLLFETLLSPSHGRLATSSSLFCSMLPVGLAWQSHQLSRPYHHPRRSSRVVALASFVFVAAVWVATVAMIFWSYINLPPRESSHNFRRNKWVPVAVLWFLVYLTADAVLRFMQYHGYTFPIEFMYTELARVKPQGLAEYFCFVAILRCEDIFEIGGFDHLKTWRYVRLFFLVLLTLVDLIGSAGDWYYRVAQVQEVTSLLSNDVSKDDCITYSVYNQLKTYADIVFYAFSLVCCVFFTFIVAKFKINETYLATKTYRLNYTIVIAAFWVHCFQCLAGTLIFDRYNVNSTQTTELIYIAIYDITTFILLFFLIRLKKLKLDPEQCKHREKVFIYTDNGYVDVHSKTPLSTIYAGSRSISSLSTGHVDVPSRKFPTNTISYIPVDQFDSSLRY